MKRALGPDELVVDDDAGRRDDDVRERGEARGAGDRSPDLVMESVTTLVGLRTLLGALHARMLADRG